MSGTNAHKALFGAGLGETCGKDRGEGPEPFRKLHRSHDIGKQDRHEFALAFERGPPREDLFCKVAWRIADWIALRLWLRVPSFEWDSTLVAESRVVRVSLSTVEAVH